MLQCMRSNTKHLVALKAIPKCFANFAKREVYIHKQLRELVQEENNLIKIKRRFKLDGNIFLEFENLDVALDDLIKKFNRPLSLSEIQVITQQMLVALNALKLIRMVHADIRLENIMLSLEPFKVKLVEFGLARNVSEMSRGDSLYRLEYRAPEILLGLRLNEAVDMWALGCLMARMYIEADLYSGECELAKMEDVVLLNGQPDDRMLFFGIHTKRYFAESGTELELKTDCVCSFQSVNCFSYGSHPPYRYSSAKRFISFNDIVMARPDATGHEDTEAFVSLLRNMLQVDPGKRITPNKALRHPFITMKHFPSDFIPHNLTVVSTSEKLPPTGSLNNMVAESSPESAGRNSRAANKSSDDSLDDEDDEFSSHSDGHVSGASANSCGDSSDDEETDSEMSGATTKSLDDLSDDEDSNAEISRASRNSSDEPSDDKETDETSPAFASDYSYISNKISNEEVTKVKSSKRIRRFLSQLFKKFKKR
uniref:homeodomain-interacting protein kinase 3-like n=1 Tax=Solea senegalensis TaxID=28829 RepID=UPI001CD86C49|nr:homeodomain-interacting protein kinase 3-like [Solea senegalensis]